MLVAKPGPVRRRRGIWSAGVGQLLIKSPSHNKQARDYGKFVLVPDKAGNRLSAAQAPRSEFANGWGRSLDDIEMELRHLGHN